ncbi:MAG: HDOD domain-containing protein [Gammaproteobacteria bacterium]
MLTRKTHLQMAWIHSSTIAATSYVLAKHIGTLNAERALLAGLIHEIGITALITTALKPEGSLNLDSDFRFVANELSGSIGAMILRAWHFPDSLVDVVLEPKNYQPKPVDKLTLSGIVRLAHYHDIKPPPCSEKTLNAEILIKFPSLARTRWVIIGDCGLSKRQVKN